MAKTNNLPSVDGPRPNGQFAETKKHVEQKIMQSLGIPTEVCEPVNPPPVDPVEGYIPRRVDVKLTRAQAVILRDKLRQLQDSGAKTADGRFVANRTQAVQWILENLPSC